MLEADENAVSQAIGGAATAGSLAEDPQQLTGVIKLLAAVSALPNMIAERGKELLFHLVVEEQKQCLADLFAVHRPSSANQRFYRVTSGIPAPRVNPSTSTSDRAGLFPPILSLDKKFALS
jgi:hypothetical protein